MSAPFVMVWRECVGFPDYEVSEHGDVRRITASKTRQSGARLRGFIDPDGYLRFQLMDRSGAKRTVIAHRLVAEAFIGPQPSERHEVAHSNGSRIANHYSNLRWALPVENHADRVVHGTSAAGERNGRATICEADVRAIRREYREIKIARNGAVSDLERRFGLCRATIVRIATGKSWRHVPMDRPD